MDVADVVIPGAVGAVLSILVSVVVQSHWANWVKGIVVVVSSILAGLATALIRGDLAGTGWLQSIGIVWGFTVMAYNWFWKPTGIGPKIELLTNLARREVTNGK